MLSIQAWSIVWNDTLNPTIPLYKGHPKILSGILGYYRIQGVPLYKRHPPSQVHDSPVFYFHFTFNPAFGQISVHSSALNGDRKLVSSPEITPPAEGVVVLG